jgi:hypothetical protein
MSLRESELAQLAVQYFDDIFLQEGYEGPIFPTHWRDQYYFTYKGKGRMRNYTVDVVISYGTLDMVFMKDNGWLGLWQFFSVIVLDLLRRKNNYPHNLGRKSFMVKDVVASYAGWEDLAINNKAGELAPQFKRYREFLHTEFLPVIQGRHWPKTK